MAFSRKGIRNQMKLMALRNDRKGKSMLFPMLIIKNIKIGILFCLVFFGVLNKKTGKDQPRLIRIELPRSLGMEG